MARLLNVRTKKRWALSETAVVGRDAQAWIELSAPCTSGRHAQLLYRGGHWRLIDLSRNGTWIDGQRIGQTGCRLSDGQRLRFGGEQGEVFEVIDTLPPEPVAVDVTDAQVRVEGEDGVLSLSGGGRDVSIYMHHEAWVLEDDDPARAVLPTDLLTLGSTIWRLVLPGAQADTVTAASDPATMLLIRHSQDFEDLELALQSASGEVTALGPRTYAPMLLLLAQVSMREIRDGADPREAGWFAVPDLLKRLSHGAPKPAVRQQVNTYRLRFAQVLLKHGAVEETAPRIERRLSSDRIRLAGPVMVEPL